MKSGLNSKLSKVLPWAFFVFLGFCAADLIILNYRDLMLPSQPPPPRPRKNAFDEMPGRGNYQAIITRNIFSADGVIPDPITATGEKSGAEEVPVPSTLPLSLVGTIVHSNPKKSIANIEVRGKNLVYAFTVGREIENMATLEKVERSRALIRNNNNSRLEFIEMKNAGQKLSFSGAGPAGGSTIGDVFQKAPNRFEMKRSDVNKYLADLPSLLQQAAMAPVRGPGGEIEGFKFLSIQPGSIYTQLGFQNGDVIKSVNGEKIDSPAKAMELFQALKNSDNIRIQTARDGRDQEHDYTIK